MADLLSRTDEHVASVQESPSPARRKRRVASLDIVRGFSVALMVFVDEANRAANTPATWRHNERRAAVL